MLQSVIEMTNPEVEGSDKANWNDTNTRHFISACLTQVRDGNRPGANLNIVGYTLARQEFNKLSGLCYSTKQIRTKWENMRKEWILWKKLLLDTGTGWSYEGGTIKATEEWWKRKKAENKEYGKFKHRGPLLPEEQEELFGKSLATGGFAVTSAEIPQEAAEKLSQPLYWSEEADNLGSEYQGTLVQVVLPA